MKKGLPVSLLLILFMAACGGGSASTATPFPTVTPIPLFQYVSPTPVSTIFAVAATATPATESTAEATAAVQSIDPKVVEAGKGRYVALTCGECHGEVGEGAGDKGPALVPMTMSQDDFITLLRSGGKLGSKHQYATNRLSDRGAQNLYFYLVSLGT